MQRGHSEGVSSAQDLDQAAHRTDSGRTARQDGLVARSGSDWTQGGWGTPWGMVQWKGSCPRMCGSPAGAAQGLWANPAGLLHAQKQCNALDVVGCKKPGSRDLFRDFPETDAYNCNMDSKGTSYIGNTRICFCHCHNLDGFICFHCHHTVHAEICSVRNTPCCGSDSMISSFHDCRHHMQGRHN